MFIDKDSIQIKIGNNAYTSLGQYLVQAEYQYNKLWSSDSGRNLAGTQSGTLVGIFPKLVLQFRPLTKSELELLVPILDNAYQTIKYYDPYKKTNVEMTTYSSDYSIIDKKIIASSTKNEGFSCSFISTSKRV